MIDALRSTFLWQQLKKVGPLKRAYRAINPVDTPYPDWTSLLSKDWSRWQDAVEAAKNGPNVLIATSIGGFAHGAVVESTLAVALTLRGARVHILLCDGVLPACFMVTHQKYADLDGFVRDGPKNMCDYCFSRAHEMYRSLDLPVHLYSELLTCQERQTAHQLAADVSCSEIGDFRFDPAFLGDCASRHSLDVGQHALAGTLRFYARGDLEEQPHATSVLRRHLEGAILTAYAVQRLLDSYAISSACFHHGIYVPQGVIGEVCRSQGVHVVNWSTAYRRRSFLFSHGDTYHHTMLTEPVANWEDMDWTPEMEASIMEYLESRWRGTRDWVGYHPDPEEEVAVIAAELGLDFQRPWVAMLTNVMWDAQIHYPANAFPDMLEWVLATIRYFARRPDLQLIVRAHPAEARGMIPAEQCVVEEIRGAFPVLPNNVTLVPPTSPISTYALASQCNSALIYGTKMGVELASVGIPVIVAGEAWIRNKGITMDANSPKEYLQLLDHLPLSDRLDSTTTSRARKYAYHFFFRRAIPLDVMEPTSSWPPYRAQLSGLDELGLGRSKGLDVICDGILDGTEFIYPAESYNQSSQ